VSSRSSRQVTLGVHLSVAVAAEPRAVVWIKAALRVGRKRLDVMRVHRRALALARLARSAGTCPHLCTPRVVASPLSLPTLARRNSALPVVVAGATLSARLHALGYCESFGSGSRDAELRRAETELAAARPGCSHLVSGLSAHLRTLAHRAGA
jgi:hypothetical protein